MSSSINIFILVFKTCYVKRDTHSEHLSRKIKVYDNRLDQADQLFDSKNLTEARPGTNVNIQIKIA